MFTLSSKRIAGGSLFEVMIATVCAGIVLSLLFGTYAAYHRFALDSLLLHRHQTTAAKVFTLVRDSIYRAGAVGCRHIKKRTKVLSSHGYTINESNYLIIAKNSLDIIYQNFPVATLLRDNSYGDFLRVDAGAWLQSGQMLLIADCKHAELFKATHVSRSSDHQIIRSEYPLVYRYERGAEVSKFISRSIYSDGDLRLVNNVSGWNFHYARHVRDLHFSRRGNGVNFWFETFFKGSVRRWYGYAPYT